MRNQVGIFLPCKHFVNDRRMAKKKGLQYAPKIGKSWMVLEPCVYSKGRTSKKKVDNRGELLTNLPRTEVAVLNTTYKVFVIGRRVLNHCGGFGVEGRNVDFHHNVVINITKNSLQ